MLRRLTAVAAVLAATALLPTAPATAGTDPMAGAPTVGDCFDITMDQAEKFATSEDPVDCAEDHTAVVIAVGELPSRLDWNSSKEAIGRAVGNVCDPAFDDRFNYDTLRYYRSQYAQWWFGPTQAQQDGGARWFDCLVTIYDDRGLIDLPGKLPRLTRKLPNVVARCVTADYKYTNCADTHAWRSSYATYIRGRATDRNVKAAAGRVCPRHVTTPRRFLYSAWDIKGKRFVLGCYSNTRR
jgi:hypothetical protein